MKLKNGSIFYNGMEIVILSPLDSVLWPFHIRIETGDRGNWICAKENIKRFITTEQFVLVGYV